jgi:collagenase-like PrtC family protease
MHLNKYSVSGRASGFKRRVIAQKLHNLDFSMFCAACMIYDLKKSGMDSVKIAGRSFPIETRLNGVRFISSCMKAAGKARSRQDYIEKAQNLYSDHFQRRCLRKNCNVLMI